MIMFNGIRIIERMTKLFNEQGDSAVYSLAEWIEGLEDDKERLREQLSEEKTKNEKLLKEDNALKNQRRRLLAKIDRLEMTGFIDEY